VHDAYHEQREYFREHPKAAEEYLQIGDSKPDAKIDTTELAATSVVAGMLMCFDDFIMKR
jgi:hypothetical protein